MKRIMIAAPKSGSGKTTITCALLQALKCKGYKMVAYKCGPDYIDPMFHERVIGIPSKNLDTFFTGESKTRELFLQERTEDEFVVLEGVMGVFDGLGGIREEGSSYHLAKVTKTPIVLVVDVKGMGRSMLPFIAGFLEYDKEHLIKGVILNRISKNYYGIMKPLIEKELQIDVVGYFPEQNDWNIKSRHLGLFLPDEITDIRIQLQQLGEKLQNTVSLDKIIEIAVNAEELKQPGLMKEKKEWHERNAPVIGVAKDEAFCFYYADNLRLLEENGAKIQFFSPLHDEKLPDVCHALYLGGGYPELYAEELSSNTGMKNAIGQAFKQNMPILAECGGFMYLHNKLISDSTACYDMAGVIPGNCENKGKLVRFGYVELQEKRECFLPKGERIKGHEFHYYDSTYNGDNCMASKPTTGSAYSCVVETENCWMGFPHLYFPSNPSFAKAFVDKAGKYMKNMKKSRK